ncbi:unnamed protein product, partial [marine sediment metagenome]
IEEFAKFVSGKAEIVESYRIENLKGTADNLARAATVGGPKTTSSTQPPVNAEVLKKCDFAIVFGGDGSIISTVRNLSGARVPVIGVNLGKLGFLAEFSVGELKKSFDEVISGKAPIEKRMMLGCRIVGDGEEKFSSSAINDVFITAGPPFRMIELKISVDGQPLAGCVSDGLIIS